MKRNSGYGRCSLIWELRSSSIKFKYIWGIVKKKIAFCTAYCALTYSYKEKDIIIEYIKKQQEHHKIESFQNEIRQFFKENGIDLDEKWFWVDS